jgi:hypothetical protein
MAATVAEVLGMAAAMVTAMAAAIISEPGSEMVARGKQAIAKVKRRSSSAECNNQPTT